MPNTDSSTISEALAPIRLGIIGFGHIGRHHLKAAQANPALSPVAVADPGNIDPASLPEGVSLYKEWQELIQHPDLDAVSVCVPHHLHKPITLAVLAAGKDVLVEKPLALTVDEGQELIDAARQHGRTIMVELTHRFYPPITEARAFIDAGHLGDIYAVEDRIVESAGAQIQPWLRTKATAGGGVALTNGVHMLDRIAAVTGQQLSFQNGCAGYSGNLGDIEDTAAMLFTLGNGAPVQVLASWPTGVGISDDELTVYGKKGTLRVWAWRGWRFEPLDINEPILEHESYPTEDAIGARVQRGVYGALAEFAAAIQESRTSQPAPEAALAAQKLIEHFYAHAEAHKKTSEVAA